ncbi:MAG TPA: circularly permuted type 2 ATP-grasp protein, partial [Bdellovibrionales bacterium]|nr:circularly permuted type 2 ATP-grasp protein [Bdellovibrionales bacterium]
MLLAILTSLIAGWPAFAAFNEVATPGGELRPAYRDSAIFPVPETRADHLLAHPMDDSIRILPIPLRISEDEYRLLQEGSVQRARALMALFQDVMFDSARQIKAARLFPKDYLEFLVLSSTHANLKYMRAVWKTRRDKYVGVFVGSDLMRDENGQWRAIEDNAGSLGGLADIAGTHVAMAKAGIGQALGEAPLVKQIASFLADIPKERWADEVVALVSSKSTDMPTEGTAPDDEESVRKARILNEMGIKMIEVGELKKDLKALDPGVKMLVNFCDPMGLELSSTVTAELMRGFSAGRYKFMVVPGVEFLGNKALLPVMDRLIRMYLGEEPKVPSQPTEWVTELKDLDVNEPGWVYKRVTANQGSGVFMPDQLPAGNQKGFTAWMKDWEDWSLIAQGRHWPHFVRQKTIQGSYIPAELPDSWIRFNVA